MSPLPKKSPTPIDDPEPPQVKELPPSPEEEIEDKDVRDPFTEPGER